MAKKKNNNNEIKRGYRLMVRCGDKYICLMETSNLEDIDASTMEFDDIEDFSNHLMEMGVIFDNADDFFIMRIESGKIYNVLYTNDLYDSEKVLTYYKDYLLKNPRYLEKVSPLRYVDLNKENYSRYEEFVDRVFYAYFFNKKSNYREIRGAYLELKDLGLVSKLLNNRLILEKKSLRYTDCIYYSDDAYLDGLLNKEGGPDWDSIYSIYSEEDVERLVKKEIRKRRR